MCLWRLRAVELTGIHVVENLPLFCPIIMHHFLSGATCGPKYWNILDSIDINYSTEPSETIQNRIKFDNIQRLYAFCYHYGE